MIATFMVKNDKQNRQEEKITKLSSESIQNEMLTITPKHPSSEYHFESQFQAKIYSFDQSFEKQVE